jgi:hypothetical protein
MIVFTPIQPILAATGNNGPIANEQSCDAGCDDPETAKSSADALLGTLGTLGMANKTVTFTVPRARLHHHADHRRGYGNGSRLALGHAAVHRAGGRVHVQR